MYTKKKAPLIGVRKWKDIHETVKKSIVIDVLVSTMPLLSLTQFISK